MKYYTFRYKHHSWNIYKHSKKVYNIIHSSQDTHAITIPEAHHIHVLGTKESFTLETISHELFHMGMHYAVKEHDSNVDVEEVAAELFAKEGILLAKLAKRLFNKLR